MEEKVPCSPSCVEGGTCKLECENNLDFINDPLDCSKYYICLPGGDTYQGSCSADAPYFDGQNQNCSTDANVCCHACEALCTEAGVQVPDPYDCHSFYGCIAPGVPSSDLHGTCPSGEIFDQATNKCAPGDTCTNICEGGGGGGSSVVPGSSTLSPLSTTESNGNCINSLLIHSVSE